MSDSMDRRELLRSRILGGAPHMAAPETVDTLLSSSEDAHAPFPLLPLQEAYWVGRSGYGPLGGNACHGYLEIDVHDLDLDRLQRACDALVARHPMLRAVIGADGMQRVLPEVGRYPLRTVRAGEDLLAVREELSHQVTPTDAWPLFDVRAAAIGNSGVWRVFISFDVLIADAQSFRILASELVDLYRDPDQIQEPIGVTFRDYVTTLQGQASEERDSAWRYWDDRLTSLPQGPDIPLVKDVGDLVAPRVERWEGRLDASQWQGLQRAAAKARVTPSTALLAAFSSALSLWSANPHYFLNLTIFDRHPVHPDIERIVGPFTSTTLVETGRDPGERIADYVGRLQRGVWEALEHRAVGGVELMREMSRRYGQEVNLPYVYTFVDSDIEDFRSELVKLGEICYAVSQTPQVLIDCQVARAGDDLLLWWDAVGEAFPANVVDEMFDAFMNAARRLTEPAGWEESFLATPPGVEELRDSVQVVTPVPDDTMLAAVLASCRDRPDANAIVASDEVCTYDALARRVFALASTLREAGVCPGDVVAVDLERGVMPVVAVLAVQACGSAYLPIEPGWPHERASQVLRSAEVRVVISDREPSLEGVFVVLPGLEPVGVPGVKAWDTTANPDDLAYVIYTSGSTGAPKGVEISHRAAMNTIQAVNRRWNVGPDDRVLGVSSMGFDLSVWDIFGTLAAGGLLVVQRPGEAAKDPSEWLDLMQTERITVWNSAPALLQLLVGLAELRAVRLPHLRLAMLSGDWIPVGLPDRLRAIAPQCSVVSLGGATEAAIWSIAYPVAEVSADWQSIPYGYPLENQAMYVLTPTGEERPTNVVGDLAIGGVGLASGYRNAPELTAQAFVDHPVHGRVYLTGDLARRLENGCLEFIGRADSQVKIQGNRVELGEIDAVLTSFLEVRAAVTVVTRSHDGREQLLSAVELADETVRGEDLRERLRTLLPEYMVPVRIHSVEVLPLTSNGKVDRNAIAQSTTREPAKVSGPRTPHELRDGSPVEAYVLSWVHEKLGRSDVGPCDNLLNAGLDSVDMLRLAAVMEETLGFHPPHVAVARNPTVETVRLLFESHVLERLLAGERLKGAEESAGAQGLEDAERGVV